MKKHPELCADDSTRAEALVKLRADDSYRLVSITSASKPEIHDDLLRKWQHLIDVCSRIMRVPSGLIMRLHEDQIEVLLKSDSEGNPYRAGETADLGLGHYCETVVGRRETLLVPDATEMEAWRDNPDVVLRMISYLGMPLLWPDEEVFGTICALDSKKNPYSQDFVDLLLTFRRAIETDLSLLVAYKQMQDLAHLDPLTRLANRRGIDDRLKSEFERSVRYRTKFSVILFDIDDFKRINDGFGHSVGDSVLSAIADIARERSRSSDFVGRWGGDELVLICPDTDFEGAAVVAESLRQMTERCEFPVAGRVTCSFGVACFRETDQDSEDVLRRADEHLYVAKQNGKNMVF